MQVTEKLARHIIWLQGVAEGEIGDTEEMTEVRDQLEVAFPVLKREREDGEFKHWLWSEKVEADQRVKNVRAEIKGLEALGAKVPFHGEGYEEYRQKQHKLSKELMDVKELVDNELTLAGLENLRAEWEVCRRIRANHRG